MVSAIKDIPVFSFDLETTGLNPHDSRILLMQIGTPKHQYVIDVNHANIEPLRNFLHSYEYKKIIHQAKFEQKFCQYHLGTVINNVFDTMLAEQIIMSEQFGRSLAYVVHKYSGVILDKEAQTSFIGMKPMQMFTDDQLEYAARDVEVLFDVMEKQKVELIESGQINIAEIEFECAAVVASMELEGIPVNTQKWRAKLDAVRIQHESTRLDVLDMIYKGAPLSEQMGMFERGGVDLNSPKQVAGALIALGIKLPKTPKGNYKTDERTLAKVKHPVARTILTYRKYQKILSTYGENILAHIHPFTNRIHPEFQQIGTETGRFACKEPNVQQIPADFRQLIGDVKDYKIVGADFSQMELRIIAQLSMDPGLIAAFTGDNDPHASTASLMFNIPIENVSKQQRFVAKTINFGIAYGMGADKLMDTVNQETDDKITFRRAQELLAQYRETYPKVSEWFYRAGHSAFVKGYSTTVGGRKRYFNRPQGGIDEDSLKQQIAAIKREGGNAPVQGTNADITKRALRTIFDDIVAYGFRASIINAVHDEIVLIAHKNHAETVSKVVEDAMLRAAQEFITVVPVKVESFVSDVWKK